MGKKRAKKPRTRKPPKKKSRTRSSSAKNGGTKGLSAKTVAEIFKSVSPGRNKSKSLSVPIAPDEKSQLEKLSAALQNDKLVLVLGAGVSIDQDLPNWNTLLQRLLFSIQTANDDPGDVDDLVRLLADAIAPSPLIAARQLDQYFNQKLRTKFGQVLHDVLYERYDAHAESHILNEIRKLCLQKDRPIAVISYNFDDLLEQCFSRLDVNFRHKAVYKKATKVPGKTMPIYHVHGYIPYGRIPNTTAIESVTLGEESYHRHYSDSYSWANLIQIEHYSQNNCLFIGTSNTDPNQRRLLDVAQSQRPRGEVRHSMILKRRTIDELSTDLRRRVDAMPSNANTTANSLAALLDCDESISHVLDWFHARQEADAASFGIGILWVDDYASIPNVISQLI